MPSQKNIDQVKDLKQKLAKAKAVVLADFSGLDVNQINQLRQKIKQAGGEFKISKNTLFKISLADSPFKKQKSQLTEALNGPNAFLFAYEDEISPLKALYQFSQENDLPEIKVGLLLTKFLPQEEVISLAKLPSLPVLQAKLVGTLNSPLYGLVYSLKANLQQLTGLLNQIKNKKEQEK